MQFSFPHITRARIALWFRLDRRELILLILAVLFTALMAGLTWDAYIFYVYARREQIFPQTATPRPAPFSFSEEDINDGVRLMRERETQLQKIIPQKN